MKFVPNGILELRLKAWFIEATYRDGKRRRLEDRLQDFFEGLLSLAMDVRQAREEAARRERLEKEGERRRKDRGRREEADQRRARRLREDVSNWRLAREIREYIAHAKACSAKPSDAECARDPVSEPFDWALEYADRVDPLVGSEPGVRTENPGATAHREPLHIGLLPG
ncbi:MAG: hypothetical protein O7H41_11485 [Planctomycetota bacterium]|nr:hypothetical protein [Planctomycetota bacterium]